MTTTPRAALLTKAFKVLKKHYKPVSPPSSRNVLEHMLYACCLEGAKHDAAEEAYAILQQTYFDWNEVRVTTVSELAEVVSALPDPIAAARRVRGVLQAMFEAHYTFDFEFLRKQNLGKSVKELSRHKSVTPFVVNYLVQSGFGGHAIPLSDGSLEVLYVIGAISDKELAQRRAPGLERAIPKKQGVEFGSLLHQLGTDYAASRHSNRVRAILLEIAPDAKERLPKRGQSKVEPAKKAKAAEKAKEASKATGSKATGSKAKDSKAKDSKATTGSRAKESKAKESKAKESKATGSKATGSKAKESKAPASKSTAKKKAAKQKTTKPGADKKAAKKTTAKKKKKTTSKGTKKGASKKAAKKSATKRLTKKKPR